MKNVWLLTLLFFAACGQRPDSLMNSQVVADTLTNNEIAADTLTESEISTDTTALRVTAFLVYENEELSSFDILNDEGIALWNTVIGEGSAERSSTQTRVIVYGNEKEIDVMIKNGEEAPIEMRAINITGQLEITVPDTGCSLVEIILSRKEKILYQRSIPFECGE